MSAVIICHKMPEMERGDGRGVLEISKGKGPFYNSY